MKYLLLVLFCCTSAYAQRHKIPSIPFNMPARNKSDYYDKLGIKDKNALIVKAGNSKEYRNGKSNFLVYPNNGAVRKFTLNNKTDEVQEIAVTAEQSETYWQFLYDYFNSDLIDREKLFDRKSTIITLDADSDFFVAYQNKKSYSLNSVASKTHIDAKSEGWEERVKLLNLIEDFQNVFSK